ncbi:MAG: CHAD domain-containing protein [Anaerolineae bacterium]|jgi:CHAD domain-containing protein|nr:CHAD domain-containing protein [Anaerolineae bacterium]
MPTNPKYLQRLTDQLETVQADDLMPEAGRKILRANFISLLEHEAQLTGDDPVHHLHQMRVATRRLRSALRVLDSYYEPKVLRPLVRMLKLTARLLGDVRDLDVMIDNLNAYRAAGTPEQQAALQPILDGLAARRATAREELFDWLESGDYRRFVKKMTAFLLEKGAGSRPPATEATPYQVRHVVPVIFHQHLAHVRAYDALLPAQQPELLHALRIEFKRLRYVLSFFSDVLGTPAADFIDEVKTVQDYLGKLNDSIVAAQRLAQESATSPAHQPVLNDYRALLEQAAQAQIAGFPEVWAHFNKRGVQRKFSDALLVIR